MIYSAFVLGYGGQTAVLVNPSSTSDKTLPKLILMQEDSMDEGSGYMPAKSFSIYGVPGLKALRDELLKAFPLENAE
jgi:hypothetical protein